MSKPPTVKNAHIYYNHDLVGVSTETVTFTRACTVTESTAQLAKPSQQSQLSRRERRKNAAIARKEHKRHARDMRAFSASLARSNIFVSTSDLIAGIK